VRGEGKAISSHREATTTKRHVEPKEGAFPPSTEKKGSPFRGKGDLLPSQEGEKGGYPGAKGVTSFYVSDSLRRERKRDAKKKAPLPDYMKAENPSLTCTYPRESTPPSRGKKLEKKPPPL